jgi:hypothetical protein
MRSPIAALALLAALAAPAGAHELRGYVSARGVEFIETQIPTYVPESFQAPEVSKSYAGFTATQHDTTVNLEVHNLDISMPATDRLRIDLALEVHAAGKLHIDYPIAPSSNCLDRLDLDYGRAVIDFDIRVEGGMPRVALADLELMISEDDIDVEVYSCLVDGVLNGVIGFAKEWLLGFLLNKAEDIARQNVGPTLEDMLAGFMRQDFSLGETGVVVALDDLVIEPSGLQLAVDLDAYSNGPIDPCVGPDPGEPQSHAGSAPDFSAAMNAHVGVAVNFGLIDDVVYHAWRRGMTCLTGDHLEALGIHIDYDHIGAMLPGFPAGTDLSLALRLASPPRIVGRAAGAGASVSLAVDGIEADIIAALPDGTERVLGITLDLEASANVAVDPTTNALIARLDGAEMKHMGLDQQAAAQLGFDPAQIRTMMNDSVVPRMLDELGELPVTGSMFAFADYAIILRNLDTSNEAYLLAEVDLFRAPADDFGPPDTAILESPAGVTSPKKAFLRVGGSDPEIPSELLRYRVVVDNAARPISPITKLSIGEVGKTKTYRVEVSAIDLAGNEDPSPAVLDLTIDGIAPAITIDGDRALVMPEGGIIDVVWTATDDTSPESGLFTTVKIYKLTDPQDALSAELVEEQPMAPGTTETQVEISSGSVYRVEVEVTDQAGNVSTSAIMIDAGNGGCLCNAGGGPGGAIPFLIGFLGFTVVMRRRRVPA